MCFKLKSKAKAKALCRQYNYPFEAVYRKAKHQWIVDPSLGRAAVEEAFWSRAIELSVRAIAAINEEGGSDLYSVEVF